MVVSLSVVYHPDPSSWLEAATAQHHQSMIQNIANRGQDQNSKSKVWFLLNVYHFWTIVKSKYHKLGTVCNEFCCYPEKGNNLGGGV